MNYKGNIKDLILIARDNIKSGQLTVKLWNNYCRLAKFSDNNFLIAMNSTKKGREVQLHSPSPDEIWESNLNQLNKKG